MLDENYYQDKDKFLNFIKTLAKLSWHLTQAMPFNRGSASVNELLITSILIHKKIRLPEYKEIVTCDLMAIFSATPEIFADDFPDFFKWEQEFENQFHFPISDETSKPGIS
ncbi:hypothetical protein [Legionella fairfieldensis]|uniref:hypothetical protein n=1 Tax=Legionella fairfieldensis TaxID=45064 RepID=UPI0004905028|nr:hypothetical protein [Legionella fairfieldensis]